MLFVCAKNHSHDIFMQRIRGGKNDLSHTFVEIYSLRSVIVPQLTEKYHQYPYNKCGIYSWREEKSCHRSSVAATERILVPLVNLSFIRALSLFSSLQDILDHRSQRAKLWVVALISNNHARDRCETRNTSGRAPFSF